ncbi:hypothetical protein BO78DRAFT_163775 [Aspergillus sclerotiicarbonarius CBS 121057]|uniref:Uncharacterized protein n=1 Tax=Aspergillus sclerotiicarbonarius (strain CBS 121057 / IBT 28362) TaxID=1448318 RepID=A0A319F5T7_ASPSB|nr:hypothetical protein BO78DRAFT_163775 [Aspergillus sclerotiicarbonarius CBS 121057]
MLQELLLSCCFLEAPQNSSSTASWLTRARADRFQKSASFIGTGVSCSILLGTKYMSHCAFFQPSTFHLSHDTLRLSDSLLITAPRGCRRVPQVFTSQNLDLSAFPMSSR